MNEAAWAGLGGALTAAFAGLAVLLAALLKGRRQSQATEHRTGLERERNAITHYQGIVDRLERQVAEGQAAIRELYEMVRHVEVDHARCRAQLEMLHGVAREQAEVMRAAGLAVRPVPDLAEPPQAPEPSPGERAAFIHKTEAQKAELLLRQPPAS